MWLSRSSWTNHVFASTCSFAFTWPPWRCLRESVCVLRRKLVSFECTIISITSSNVVVVRRERAASEMDFSSPAKRSKLSRQKIVVGDFNREAIRRHIYQVYEAKENLTPSKILVRKYFLSFWIVKKSWFLALQQVLWENSLFCGGRTSLQKLLKAMGFKLVT